MRTRPLRYASYRPALLSGARRSWSPLSLGSSLAAWYKADAGCYTDAACLFASASSQYLSKTSPTFAPTTKMTIAFDFKPTSTASAQTAVARMASGTQNQFSVLVLSGGALRIRVSSDLTDTSNYADTTETLSNGTNARIVIVYDGTLAAGSRLAVYINGVAATLGITGTIPATLTTSTDDLTVGTSGGGNFADGALARLGFSSQALSGAALTAAHTSTFWADMTAARQADWFSFYNLCEASSTRVDSTGLNNLTPTNGPTVAAGPGEGLCVNNSPVKRIESQYGSIHLSQSTIAKQPLWVASGKNGRPVLRYSAADSVLVASAATLGFSQLSSFLAFMVTSVAGYNGILTKTSGGAPAPFDWYTNAGGAESAFLEGSGVNSTTPVSANVWSVRGVTYDDATIRHYLGATADGSGASAAGSDSAGSSLRLGNRDDDFTDFAGDFGEVVLVGRVLTAGEIASLNGYMAPRYT